MKKLISNGATQSESNSPSQSISEYLPSQNDAFQEEEEEEPLPDEYHFADGEPEEAENTGEGAEGGDEDRYVEEEEGEDEEREVEEPAMEVAAVATVEQRQKLAEGFYEVEAIRRKRICKRVPQYLIKWRGWPESANTWEPVEHLQTCPDIVEAYEERLNSGLKNSRKRKRKFTQPKKKMQYSYTVSKSKVKPPQLTLENEPPNRIGLDQYANLQAGMVEVVVRHDESIRTSRATKNADCNESETVSPHLDSSDKKLDTESCDPNTSERDLDMEFQNVPVEGVSLANYQSKANSTEVGQSTQQRGAKRRKSGSVRRFTPDMTSFNLDCTGNTLPGTLRSCNRVEQSMLGNSDIPRKKKFDNSRSSAIITRLVKPISYSASVTNNVQDVSVTFVAMRDCYKHVGVLNCESSNNNFQHGSRFRGSGEIQMAAALPCIQIETHNNRHLSLPNDLNIPNPNRSDGKEVMVDNKFLKANNPQLLINFYEQHLRYNP